MKFSKLIIVFIFSLLFACNANAENWVFIGKSETRNQAYLDPSTIKEIKNYRVAWGMVLFENGEISKGKVRYFCDQDKLQLEYSVNYDDVGNILNSGYIYQTTEIIPGSISETMYNFVCNHPLNF